MNNRLAIAVLVTGFIAMPAAAFDFKGATVKLENRESDDFLKSVHGSAGVELSFGSAFGVQIGLKNTEFPGTFHAPGYELHLVWRPAQVDGLALGAFAGQEDFAEFSSNYYKGVEARYQIGQFDIEGAVMAYGRPNRPDNTHAVLDVTYGISDRIAAFAGFAYYDMANSTNYTDYLYLGAEFKATDDLSLYGSFGGIGRESGATLDVVTVGLRYDFGQGVTFRNRSYYEINPYND